MGRRRHSTGRSLRAVAGRRPRRGVITGHRGKRPLRGRFGLGGVDDGEIIIKIPHVGGDGRATAMEGRDSRLHVVLEHLKVLHRPPDSIDVLKSKLQVREADWIVCPIRSAQFGKHGVQRDDSTYGRWSSMVKLERKECGDVGVTKEGGKV